MMSTRPRMTRTVLMAALFLFLIPVVMIERSSVKELEYVRARSKEFAALSKEYGTLKDRVGIIERKPGSAVPGSLPQALDGILSSLGIRVKLKSVKSSGSRELAGMTEESAELQLDKMTLNETVNLFHSIDNAPGMLSVKRVALKKSFEDPESLDLVMSVSLFTGK